MKYLLILTMLISCSTINKTIGEKSFQCEKEEALYHTYVDSISSDLQCGNGDQVKSDVYAVIKGSNICKPQQEENEVEIQIINLIECNEISSFLIKDIPEEFYKEWKCKIPHKELPVFSDKLNKMCELIKK